jgi:RsiW-degrading membrane proteinase PrsW (M82 family)
MADLSWFWTLIIVGAATALWILYLYRLDRNWKKKDGGHLVVTMVIAGGLSIIPTLWVYRVNPFAFTYWVGPFAYNFAVVGLTEELVKYLTFIAMTSILKSIREPQDGIIQGAAVGVGFSAVEDVAYGFIYGPGVALTRSIIIGVHALAGAIWGYFWAGAVYENTLHRNPQAYRSALLGFVPLALAHSLYNSIWEWTPFSNEGLVWNGILLAALLFAANRAYRHLTRRSPYYSFPYADAAIAVTCIRAGLTRTPGSLVLKRRLAVYLLASGRPGAASRLLGEVATKCRSGSRPPVQLLRGVALMAAGRPEDGERLVRESADAMSKDARKLAVREISAITANRALSARVSLLMQPPAELLPPARPLRLAPTSAA